MLKILSIFFEIFTKKNGFGQIWNPKTREWEWTKEDEEKIKRGEAAFSRDFADHNSRLWQYDQNDRAWNQYLDKKKTEGK